jgi:hypothetical protein
MIWRSGGADDGASGAPGFDRRAASSPAFISTISTWPLSLRVKTACGNFCV